METADLQQSEEEMELAHFANKTFSQGGTALSDEEVQQLIAFTKAKRAIEQSEKSAGSRKKETNHFSESLSLRLKRKVYYICKSENQGSRYKVYGGKRFID